MPTDPAAAADRIAAYLAAHDDMHADDEGAGGDSTRTEIARLVHRSGTHRVLVDDLRVLVGPRAAESEPLTALRWLVEVLDGDCTLTEEREARRTARDVLARCDPAGRVASCGVDTKGPGA